MFWNKSVLKQSLDEQGNRNCFGNVCDPDRHLLFTAVIQVSLVGVDDDLYQCGHYPIRSINAQVGVILTTKSVHDARNAINITRCDIGALTCGRLGFLYVLFLSIKMDGWLQPGTTEWKNRLEWSNGTEVYILRTELLLENTMVQGPPSPAWLQEYLLCIIRKCISSWRFGALPVAVMWARALLQ